MTRSEDRRGLSLRHRSPGSYQGAVIRGLVVLQERRLVNERRIPTLAHTFLTWEHDPRGEILLSAQRKGIAASLVHSPDAAHMMRTALAQKREGINDFAMVHDSYAVHAADVPVMDRVLREEFVRLHREFTLRCLWDELKRQAPHFCLALELAVGALDLALVQ